MNAQRRPGENISHRRRAIYMGLRNFFKSEDLIKLMCLWQQNYAHLPKFAITNFVRKITDDAHMESLRPSIQLSVTSSLMLAEDKLGPDPLPEMRMYLSQTLGIAGAEAALAAGGGGGEVSSGPVADSARVFELLINTVLEKISVLDEAAGRDVRTAMIEELATLNIKQDALNTLAGWLRDKSKYMQVSLEPEQMQKLTHTAYVASCKYLGPVRSDRIMSEALEVTESSNTSKRFSPREFM